MLKCKQKIKIRRIRAGNSEVSRYYLRFKTISYLCDVEKRPAGDGYLQQASASKGAHKFLSYYG